MATKRQELIWELYNKKSILLIKKGLKSGKISAYDAETIENLRNVYVDGMRASIVILNNSLCHGYCYDRAVLISYGFMDGEFRIVDAKTDNLMLNPKLIDRGALDDDSEIGVHRFVERTLEDGSVWVYDTTEGMVFERDLYYKIFRPRIINVISKDEVKSLKESKHISVGIDILIARLAALITLPLIEANYDPDDVKELYTRAFLKEVELYKKDIDFEYSEKVASMDEEFLEETRNIQRKLYQGAVKEGFRIKPKKCDH